MVGIAIESFFDDPFGSKTPKILVFDTDFLEVVCCLNRLKKDMSYTYAVMKTEQVDYSIITDEDRAQAKSIRRYFQNSLLLRRLNNRFVSPWMKDTEELLSNICTVKMEQLKIAVKLPLHYQENLLVDEVVKSHKSLPESKNNRYDPVDDEIRFIKHYQRNTIKNKSDVFFFEDSKNRLIKVEIKPGDISLPLWKHIVKTNHTVRIKGNLIVKKLPGHLFSLYELTTDYEFCD